jgi:polar amino acid transport system permease protein
MARMIARAYLELIRNTPLLVQLFFIYFVMAPIFDLGRFASAVLSLSLFEGAYASEIFRAGIVSIHKGQWEAAQSLGLSTVDTYRRIILPQAIRRILPPLTSQAISLVKDSALVSTIAVYDLTMRGREIISETFLAFEIWFTVAAIYLYHREPLHRGRQNGKTIPRAGGKPFDLGASAALVAIILPFRVGHSAFYERWGVSENVWENRLSR